MAYNCVEYTKHITVAKGGARHRTLNKVTNQLDTEKVMRFFGVETECTPCHYGGERKWLICPRCGTKRLTLYVFNTCVLCRTCARLIYFKQADSKKGRVFTNAIYDYNLYMYKASQIRRPYYNGELTKRAKQILKHLYIGKDAIIHYDTSF